MYINKQVKRNMSVQYKKIFLFKMQPVKTSLNILCRVASEVCLTCFKDFFLDILLQNKS